MGGRGPGNLTGKELGIPEMDKAPSEEEGSQGQRWRESRRNGLVTYSSSTLKIRTESVDIGENVQTSCLTEIKYLEKAEELVVWGRIIDQCRRSRGVEE